MNACEPRAMKNESLTPHLEVVRVLKQFTPNEPAASWNIKWIGQGYQARLFLAQCKRDFVVQPVEHTVVVKLYKHAVAEDREAFLSEMNGLNILSESLPKNVCDGWTIRSPVLLYASDNPLALVMSALTGVSLDVWLHSNVPAATEIESIVEAMLASLQVLWSEGFMYGDLNLKNILYDSAARTLSFIDPGLPAEYFRCADVSQNHCPMSRDIAYLLFSVAVSVKSTLGNPAARKRQLFVASSLVQRYFESFGSRQQQTTFLDEVRLCLETHLQELNCSWSPAGIWRHLVKQITRRSLNRTLGQLVDERYEVRL